MKHNLEQSETQIAGDRILHGGRKIAVWPEDIIGWLRVPSMIAAIIGLLGVLKSLWPAASRLLHTLNLPAVELCWLMLGVGGTIYLMSVICGWIFDDVTIYRPYENQSDTKPRQWRGM